MVDLTKLRPVGGTLRTYQSHSIAQIHSMVMGLSSGIHPMHRSGHIRVLKNRQTGPGMSYFLHDMVQSQTIEAEYYLRKRSRQHKPHEIKIRRTGKSWTGVTTEVCMAMVDWCKDAFGQPGSELAFKWAWHSRTGYTSFFFANKAHASMFKFNFHGKDFDEILPENIEDEA